MGQGPRFQGAAKRAAQILYISYIICFMLCINFFHIHIYIYVCIYVYIFIIVYIYIYIYIDVCSCYLFHVCFLLIYGIPTLPEARCEAFCQIFAKPSARGGMRRPESATERALAGPPEDAGRWRCQYHDVLLGSARPGD